ncbi:probable adenylate kinase [Halobacterium hubeiense]|uniref:Putative adenylate kinase n=1 Tax=Halobacterium hubeiense TaxID=1407499 RepID=A0A0U5H2S0_9EURY|nr:adenylate kinase family protein [Halobacterium hubeiense]CQH55416.1 probable adenylate kinase [Halobacterium hubeiense]
MRVAVTGTPGTGKTTATEHLDTDLDIVHLNDVIQEEDLYTEVDEARDSKVADLDAVRDWLDGREDVLVESHLSHLLDADRVVVLRCAPGELERRLIERGEPSEKAEENAESEALDVILSETVRDHGKPNVYEIDTTDRDPAAVADDIEAVLAGDRDPSAGEVDFTEYL